MKYCSECDYKLPQPTPNYCPECGNALSPPKDKPTPKIMKMIEQKKQEPKEKGPPKSAKWWLPRVVLALLFLALLLVIATYPLTQWARAKTAGANYYQYLTVFTNDMSNLASLSKQYSNTALTNSSFEKKAKMAGNYALKASQAITTWDYFKSFILQNEGPLERWDVNATPTKLQIEYGKSDIRSTAGSMALELEQFADANQLNKSSIADTLTKLKALKQ